MIISTAEVAVSCRPLSFSPEVFGGLLHEATPGVVCLHLCWWRDMVLHG